MALRFFARAGAGSVGAEAMKAQATAMPERIRMVPRCSIATMEHFFDPFPSPDASLARRDPREAARKIERKRDHSQRGAILVFVVLLIALIATLLAAAQHLVVSNARAAKVFADSLRAEELGRTAVDLVMAQIQTGDPTGRRNGSFTAFLDQADLHIDYLSESARIDVNLAPPALIAGLARAAGLEPNDASALSERIASLRGAGNKKSIEDIEAVASTWDLEPEVFTAMRPYLTVTNGSAKVDPLIADPKVVAALFEGEGPASELFLARRAEGFATENDATSALPSRVREAVTFKPARALRAHARVHLADGFQRSYEFVLTMPKADDEKAEPLAWRMIP